MPKPYRSRAEYYYGALTDDYDGDLPRPQSREDAYLLKLIEKINGLSSVGVYTPRGSRASVPDIDDPSVNVGDVFSISSKFTTNNRFLEGEGVTCGPGTNIVCIRNTTGDKAWDAMSTGVAVDTSLIKGSMNTVTNAAIFSQFEYTQEEINSVSQSASSSLNQAMSGVTTRIGSIEQDLNSAKNYIYPNLNEAFTKRHRTVVPSKASERNSAWVKCASMSIQYDIEKLNTNFTDTVSMLIFANTDSGSVAGESTLLNSYGYSICEMALDVNITKSDQTTVTVNPRWYNVYNANGNTLGYVQNSTVDDQYVTVTMDFYKLVNTGLPVSDILFLFTEPSTTVTKQTGAEKKEFLFINDDPEPILTENIEGLTRVYFEWAKVNSSNSKISSNIQVNSTGGTVVVDGTITVSEDGLDVSRIGMIDEKRFRPSKEQITELYSRSGFVGVVKISSMGEITLVSKIADLKTSESYYLHVVYIR